jgi:tRNA G18 (ribose-2'-O)-methylase SpoU
MIRKLNFEEIQDLRPKLEDADKLQCFPVVMMVENIRSLYNVGSFFRTSDGAGISKLYLGGYTGCPPRKEIDKTALGSTESVSWEHCVDPVEKVKELKQAGYKIVVLEHTEQSKNYNQVEYEFPVCIILGNEKDGVTQELCAEADFAIEIPMYGIKQSLNVAVAFGIIAFHVVAQCKNL